ncbi:MAG: ABC transporter permease [Paludibacteraceae bacterium]|nr:ABC transporter permease [Paludibacteraceae bacterium]
MSKNRFRFAFFVACRYLFSKKKQNAINVISFIAASGVCLGTLALVCVLSVFNGFESLVKDMFAYFDPDLKIEAIEGKTFQINNSQFEQIKKMENVICFSEILEDNALIAYKNRQTPVVIKGIDKNYLKAISTDSILYDGQFLVHDYYHNYAVIGIGLAWQLNIGLQFSEALKIFVPKREEKINIAAPDKSFNQQNALITGVYLTNEKDLDHKYLFVDIKLARSLFERDSTNVSAIELKVHPQKVDITQKEIKKLLGKDFSVKNKYEQQADSFRIMQIEKWITFLILSLILLVATFNIIGSLSMLIIDKKEDISTLHKLGASQQLIQMIFLFEGWLISITGAFVGLILGVLLCLSQQWFGWLKLNGGFIIDTYPIIVQFSDIILIFFTVVALGFLAACYPVQYLRKKVLTQ